MAGVSCSRTVHAPPEAIWDVLADFGAVSTWADFVDHSCLLSHSSDRDPTHPIGMARRIQVGRDTFVETITRFDPPRVLAYDITGLPRFVSVHNRWTLQPGPGDTTAVTLTSTVHVTRPLLRPVAERAMAAMMGKRSEALLTSLAAASEGVTT